MKFSWPCVLAPLCALLVACGAPLRPTGPSDDIPERAFGPRALAAEFAREAGHRVSPVLETPAGATRAGLMLDIARTHAAQVLHIEVRGLAADGATGAWVPVRYTFSEGLMRVATADLALLSSGVQLRLPDDELPALDWVLLSAVIPEPERLDASDVAVHLPDGLGVEAASTAQRALLDGVRPRSDWGARATQCNSRNPTKTRISIHHTVTPTGAADFPARLRAIQAFHMDTRRWCDTGYHFLATVDGTVWEARPADQLGAHVGGYNTNNLGISMVGCFHPTADCDPFPPQLPPETLIDGVAGFVATAAAHYGISISSSTVMGHRDNPEQSTSCPGDNGHARLADIRARALGMPSTTVPTGKVQGVVWDLSVTSDVGQSSALGARLPGATVSISSGESTEARASDAYWSFDVEPGTYTLTVALEGYALASREVLLSSGDQLWSSVGLSPAEVAASLWVTVVDDESGMPLALARVEATGAEPVFTDTLGKALFQLAAGTITVRASAEGHRPSDQTVELLAGETEEVTLRLAADEMMVPIDDAGVVEPVPADDAGVVEPAPADGGDGAEPLADAGAPDSWVRIPPSPDVSSGCGCSGATSHSGEPVLLALLGGGWLGWRRRRQERRSEKRA